MSTIIVTGGTGTLGSLVVERLRAAGHAVRVVSRHAPQYPVDLRDGTGLDAALAGADTVVHCASSPRGGDDRAARHLVEAARRAGIRHLVHISIVGVDVVPLRYYTVKHRVERILQESGLGVTILRTTQFHDLVAQAAATLARLPLVLVPAGVRFQPVAAEEVADRLAELAVGAPAGRVPDMGGPHTRTLADLVRAYLAARGSRRRVVEVPLPGKAYAGFRRGGNLAPDHAVGHGTFEAYLRADGARRRP
ncbi:SDR family oxidoreductase [Streptomyces antimicrobicus]|uniref:NAD(P)H-binding protein n=1 Tax=Streptomyces antimicrobicus TaxID=2883108 RepID=A0ABS8B7L0_9ACTN|nr:NAD(P)H-binding protein [Streptomyces antimicrobicus]MCB5180600.1 NAD(P)H-binding protein [Streptomyces antimicrobicus]